jgi:putative N6-adenine-specific DNA methylase
MALQLVATCGRGLEELLLAEVAALGVAEARAERGAVLFSGSWPDCWRANWRLRTANRVLVELAGWPAPDGGALTRGARELVRRREPGWDGVEPAELFDPSRSISVRASSASSSVRDVRWAALTVKDGLVDGQRQRFGRRSRVDRDSADLPLRLRLFRNRATLLLDTSGDPLDRRGYRTTTGPAPVREQLAAACVLAAGVPDGPVVDPMCGTGTLLVEAGWIALGRPPGNLRRKWLFADLPGFDRQRFEAIRSEPLPVPAPSIRLVGVDHERTAVAAASGALTRAGLTDRAALIVGDAFSFEPPEGPGLVVVNPPHGERLAADQEDWKRLGDLLKQRYTGWRAVVLAGGPSQGKWIGLKPARRIPVSTGPHEARILLFDLY